MNELAGGLRPSSEHAALHSSLTMPSHPGHWQKPLAAISAHESFEQSSATARQGDTKTGHASLHSSATMLAHPGHWQRPPSAISKHESVEHSSASGQMNATDFFLVSSAFATDFFLVSPACAVAWSLRLISRHASLHSSATMLAHPGHSQKPLAAISAHESFEQPSATARQGDTKTGGGLRPSSEHASLHSSATMPSHPGHWQKPLAAISSHESVEQTSASGQMN